MRIIEYFKKKKVAAKKENDLRALADQLPEAKDHVQLAAHQLFMKRAEIQKKKQGELVEVARLKLNEYMKAYFTSFERGDENLQENIEIHDMIDKEWMSYVQKFNKTTKLIQLQPQAFRENVKQVIESANKK